MARQTSKTREEHHLKQRWNEKPQKSQRKEQEPPSGERERRGTSRDELVTKKLRKGPWPKQARRRGRTSETKNSTKERTGTKTGRMKPEGTMRLEGQGLGKKLGREKPQRRKKIAENPTEKYRKMAKDSRGKTNNPGRRNEKKMKKRWRERHPSIEKERNENRQKDEGRV